MIKCEDLAKIFKENYLTFFSGVPDSIFKDWMKYLAEGNGLQNVIACNECEATAISTGYHLATGKTGVVYMQNSGLGKVVNPLTSLLSREVYSIPTLFMIGWRGEPGKKDEPQHKMMGRVMIKQLETLEIPYMVLSENIVEAGKIIKKMRQVAEQEKHPSAIIIRKGTLKEYVCQNQATKLIFPPTIQNYDKNISNISGEKISLKREDAIKTIIDSMNGSEVIVSTTGKTSRELFEYREELEQDHSKDFLTIGSMGCSSAIALGIALNSQKQVYVFDGDGAVLMQMGTIATIGHYKPNNLKHIIFDNQAYGSTGEQPSISTSVDFGAIALASGYHYANNVNTSEGIRQALQEMNHVDGPSILRILLNPGARKDLGRPTTTPIENKEAFMDFLGK